MLRKHDQIALHLPQANEVAGRQCFHSSVSVSLSVHGGGGGLQSHHIGPQLCTGYCLSLPDMFNFKQVVGILLECFLVQIYITYLINLKIVFIPDEPLYQLMVHYTSRAACESRVGRCFVCFFRPLTVMVNSPVIAKSNLTKRNPVNITLR